MPAIPPTTATFLATHVALLVRLAAVVCIVSGLVGGGVWLVDLTDREDGDSLRLGFWHNPFMQFPAFHEPFLDLSMTILFICSAAVGCGGLLLLVPYKWGVPMVTWSARVSIVINGVIAFFILAMMIMLENRQWGTWHLNRTSQALMLRLGAIAIDLALWGFVGSEAVRSFCRRQSLRSQTGFDVILKGSKQVS
jgi:hypothetical protein